MNQNRYVIYKHTNIINNKSYIGQTCRKPGKRWGVDGQNYLHHTKFYRDILKDGWQNFKHEILLENLTKEEACEKENYYIDLYDTIENGYNTKHCTIINKNVPIRPVGRPSVDRSMKFNRTFETTTALDNRLKEIARRRGITLSALIRDILEKFFEERRF